MSTIEKSEAIVLRTTKYRDTSKIVTLYTRRFGKVTGIVKGVRQARNKYGSALEPLSHVSIVFYMRPGREIQTVSQCDNIRLFRQIPESLERLAIAMRILELVNIVGTEEEGSHPLFDLLSDTLAALNLSNNPHTLLYYFELRLCQILGFAPSFDRCIGCESVFTEPNDGGKVRFHLARGGPLCRRCEDYSGQKEMIPAPAVQTLALIMNTGSVEALDQLVIPVVLKSPIENLLWSFLRFHVADIRTLKSVKVFSKILENS